MTPGDRTTAAQLLADAGFQGWQIVVMGAIGMAESALNEHAIHLNNEDPTSPWYLTLDLGAWQINDAAGPLLIAQHVITPTHPLSQQLFNATTNAQAARTIFTSRHGDTNPVNGYNAWKVFKTGAYLTHRPAAATAALTIGAIT